MEERINENKGYGKRPFWQWVVIYLIVGAIIYGLVYYLFLGKRNNAYSNAYITPTTINSAAISPELTQAVEEIQTTPGTKDAKIALNNTGFTPQSLTIKAGTTVVWTNESGRTATVNSSQHPTHTEYPPLNLGEFADGGSLSLTFNTPGVFKYHNHLNPSEFGTITVE